MAKQKLIRELAEDEVFLVETYASVDKQWCPSLSEPAYGPQEAIEQLEELKRDYQSGSFRIARYKRVEIIKD